MRYRSGQLSERRRPEGTVGWLRSRGRAWSVVGPVQCLTCCGVVTTKCRYVDLAQRYLVLCAIFVLCRSAA